VGQRVADAVAATWQAVGCNTNLGILLLCAPLAAAAESQPLPLPLPQWQQLMAAQMQGLSLADADAAFRAIAMANPGGLGRTRAQDVHATPTVDLRSAMALAANRDRIARQYRDDYAELLAAAQQLKAQRFVLPLLGAGDAADAHTTAAVQRLYLQWLASAPDSHIVRKHGEAVAQNVMASAQPWAARADAGADLDNDPAFAAWDDSLKVQGINPGTAADLTVAALMLAGLAANAPKATPGEPGVRWHGS
jgi:triphosphoribosyl-dephospho-CoA synthase